MFICGIILTALLSASGTAASDGKRGKQGHRPDFPSLQTMVKGKSNLLPTTVVDSLSFASTSNGAGEGLTYMEFFSEENCGGGVTYSTGFRAGLCLPASDYVRPPFANDDDYPDSFPFQSLKISNVTASCDNWYITYYSDKYCATVHNVARTDNYTDCRPAGSLLVTNLVSARGKCTLAPAAPVLASSYVISDYAGNSSCSEQELVSYTAYTTDTCFGYVNGNSSTLFTANVTANTVRETQFYHNSQCLRSADAYQQTDLTISGDACYAVQSPGLPAEDDAVAVTEFIGQSLVVMVPTLAPSPAPSAIPTIAPSTNDFVNFAVQQVINGIDLATYNTNATLYSYTLRQSIAACMNGVLPDNIVDLVVTAVPSASRAAVAVGAFARLRSVSATSASISTAYQVSVYGSTLSYAILSQQLTDSVNIGTFSSILHSFAEENGAVGFETASSNSVSTQDLLAPSGGSSKPGLNGGEIAGIVIGSVALLALMLFCKHRADKRSKEVAGPAAPAVEVQVANPLAQK